MHAARHQKKAAEKKAADRSAGGSRHGSVVEDSIELPAFPEQERAFAAASDTYAATKAEYQRATKQHAEIQQQQEAELAANPKAKVDPAVEAELAALAEEVAERKEKARAAKHEVQRAGDALNRAKKGTWVKMRSERGVLQSRLFTDMYGTGKVDANHDLYAGVDKLKELRAAKRREEKAAQQERPP